MIIVNTSDSTQTTVASIDSETELFVDDNIFAVSGKNYAIYGGVQNGAVLYVGTAGNLRVLTAAGDDVIFVNINTGAFIPVQVIKVFATSTTASNILALW